MSFLDNQGLAVLLGLWKQVNERGKRLIVDDARGQVAEKLRSTGTAPLLQPG